MDKNMMDHDYQILKHTAVNSFVVMLGVLIVTIVCTKYKHSTIYAGNTYDTVQLSADAPPQYKNRIEDTETILKRLKGKYLRIQKPEGEHIGLTLKDLYMKQSIELYITNLAFQELNYDSVIRTNGETVIMGEPKYGLKPNLTETTRDSNQKEAADSTIHIEEENHANQIETTNKANQLENNQYDISTLTMNGDEADNVDFVKNINITYNYNQSAKNYSAVIEILMDNVYVHTIYEDENYFYIKLELPRDVYDQLIVVDIGHGGKDSGAYPTGSLYEEKDINLFIGLYLKELLDNENIKVYYTRLADETVYLRPRVALANNLQADLFISIHCNGSELRQPNGMEVLYKKLNNTDGFSSKKLSKLFLEELSAAVSLRNRGVIARDDVYIIGNSEVPVALIEVAYMTNPDDYSFLVKQENQKAAAVGIRNGIMRAFRVLEKEPINSAKVR